METISSASHSSDSSLSQTQAEKTHSPCLTPEIFWQETLGREPEIFRMQSMNCTTELSVLSTSLTLHVSISKPANTTVASESTAPWFCQWVSPPWPVHGTGFFISRIYTLEEFFPVVVTTSLLCFIEHGFWSERSIVYHMTHGVAYNPLAFSLRCFLWIYLLLIGFTGFFSASKPSTPAKPVWFERVRQAREWLRVTMLLS